MNVQWNVTNAGESLSISNCHCDISFMRHRSRNALSDVNSILYDIYMLVSHIHTYKQFIYKYVDFLLTNQSTKKKKNTYIEILSSYEFIVKWICLCIFNFYCSFFIAKTNIDTGGMPILERRYRHSIEFKHHLASQSQSTCGFTTLCREDRCRGGN